VVIMPGTGRILVRERAHRAWPARGRCRLGGWWVDKRADARPRRGRLLRWNRPVRGPGNCPPVAAAAPAAQAAPASLVPGPGPAGAGLRVAIHGPTAVRAGDTVERMDDKEILAHIDDLIKTEHELRAKLAAGQITTDDEHRQLSAAEAALDQCWDLLRQRRARREFGEDPSDAQVRPASEVEGYRQ
jgi:Protein of unknown function (DUF2630)